MIIQPSFGGCLHLRIAIDKTTIHWYAPTCGASQRTILHWYAPTAQCIAKNRRRAVSYVSTGLARLPRDTGGTRNYRRRAVVEIPSPHRHRRGATALFRNPVRGAKRMRAGILRILLFSRAGGTPLPMAGRLTQLAKIFPVIYTTALRQ